MSNAQNDELIEGKWQDFMAGNVDVKEAIIAEMKEQGFGGEAEQMQSWADEEGWNYSPDSADEWHDVNKGN